MAHTSVIPMLVTRAYVLRFCNNEVQVFGIIDNAVPSYLCSAADEASFSRNQ
jgi:hypothetical protein